jgi:zinc/manganese transport system substrate-binding protein
MAENVAGDDAEVATLVGPDADAHVFEPTAADARVVARADLLIINGLYFDAWALKLAKSSGTRAKIVAAIRHTRRSEHENDPHAWQNPSAAAIMVRNIAIAMIAADAPNAAAYRTRVEAYQKKLDAMDREFGAAFAKLPKLSRRVITTHNAFSYLGYTYDIEFIAPLGISTDAQPSAKAVATLIQQIKREKIRAVFVENISDPRLIEQIARETGVKIGGKLYSDALSTKAGPAPTYVAMMRHNVRLLTAAMAKGS